MSENSGERFPDIEQALPTPGDIQVLNPRADAHFEFRYDGGSEREDGAT